MDLYSVKRPRYDLYEMELIGDPSCAIAVPAAAPDDLKRTVMAALKAHSLGYRSVDYVLRVYGSQWTFPPPEEGRAFLLRTLRAAESVVDNIDEHYSHGTVRPDHVGLFAAEMALARLKPTFRSAMLLIMQGYPFEASAMCRIILEQYGYSYAVFKINDTEKILKVKASKTITNLKRLLPYAGKVYGYLSSHSHLDPKDVRHYTVMREGVPCVRFALPEKIKPVVYYFLRLVVDFRTVVQEISGEYLQLKQLYEDSFILRQDHDRITKAISALEKEVAM